MSNFTVAPVKLSDLYVDIDCQQPIRPGKVKKLVDSGFDVNLAGTIIVSERTDGTRVILDGQHRTQAALESGVDTLPALIFTGLSLETEAEMFLGHNTKSNPTPVSKFRVAVNAGHVTETHINEILANYGWKVSEGSSPRYYFKAVGAALEIYQLKSAYARPDVDADIDVDGPTLLEATIKIITDAYGTNSKAMHSSIVKSLAYFLQAYWNEADPRRVSGQLMTVKPETLVAQLRSNRDALGIRAEVAGAYAIVTLYNERLRSNRLDKSTLISI